MRSAPMLALALSALVLACSSGGALSDAGVPDAGGDAWTLEDAGADAGEGGTAGDAGDPNAILGTFGMVTCPLVSMDVASPQPSLRQDSLLFAASETWDKASLSPGGQILFDTPNAGGSSFESEVMSFEILHFCEGARLLKTETEIGYVLPDDAGANSITDILVEIGGKKVGVSVTRVYKPKPLVLTVGDAQVILEGKLAGVNRSSMRVLPEDKWVKQILHVFVADPMARDATLQAYAQIDAQLKADTIVLLTETTGGGFIYCNPDPPLGTECPPL